MLTKELFLLLLLETAFVNSLVRIFSSNGSTTEYDSLSFFQQAAPKFDIRGIPVEMILAPKGEHLDDCDFPQNITAFAKSEEENTVVFLDFSGSSCLFRCLSDTLRYYNKFVTYLTENGYPNPDTYVLVRKILSKGDPGDPYYDIASSKLSVGDDAPPLSINFQMVDIPDPNAILDQLRDPENTAVQVIQEPGQWNRYFLNGFYKFSLSMNVAILALFILISFYNVYVAYLDEVIKFDLRNVIFVLALIVSILNITLMCMRPYSLKTNILTDAQGILIITALHLMLYLWTICLRDFYPRNQIIGLRIFVCINLILLLSSKTLDFILHFKDSISLNNVRDFISAYLVVTLQILSAGVYLFFGLYFRRRGQARSVEVTESTLYTLKVITALAYVGFYSNLFVSLFNTSFYRALIHYAKWSYTRTLIYNFISVCRCITFLLIITARGKPRMERDLTDLELKVNRVKREVFHAFSRVINPIKNVFQKKPSKEEP